MHFEHELEVHMISRTSLLNYSAAPIAFMQKIDAALRNWAGSLTTKQRKIFEVHYFRGFHGFISITKIKLTKCFPQKSFPHRIFMLFNCILNKVNTVGGRMAGVGRSSGSRMRSTSLVAPT